MRGFLCLTLVLSSVVAYVTAGGSTLKTIDGQLVSVVDNCTPGDDSTCPDGHCCIKERLAYIPEFTGPRPVYQITCTPYRKHGELCYSGNLEEYCPCDPTLHCSSNGIFGYCE